MTKKESVWEYVEGCCREFNEDEPYYMHVIDESVDERVFKEHKEEIVPIIQAEYVEAYGEPLECEYTLREKFSESDSGKWGNLLTWVNDAMWAEYNSINREKAEAEHKRDVRTQAMEMGYHNYANGVYFPSDDGRGYY
jgi:hypothetical protein|tara:strand:- start:1110 stop:1523 length:414 start_codon:yes stop_codon:yes gene_type:complete